MLISPDTEVFDRLEDLMLQVALPKRPYRDFHIEHASAFWVRLNLEDCYRDLEEGESEAEVFYRQWNGNQHDDDSGPAGLGKWWWQRIQGLRWRPGCGRNQLFL